MKIDKYTILFIIILLIATYLRLDNLAWEILGGGEVEIYQAANDYAKGNILKSFYIFDTPPLFKYLGAVILLTAGFSEVALRIIPAIFGIATIILLYFFVMKFYNSQKLALLSSAILSLSFIFLFFSRYLQLETALAFFFLAAFYLFFSFTEYRKKNYLLFGLVLALGMLTKFIMLYAIIIIIAISIIRKHISFRKKPLFSISIDNFLLKSIIVAIILFFVLWPHALLPIQTNISVSILFRDGPHVNELSPKIPQLLLSLGKRSVSVTPPGIYAIPISYFFLFLVKENIFIIALFFIGLIAMLKKPKNIDKLVLVSLLIFFLLLWLQSWGFTYRYLAIIMPFIALVASRWIEHVKEKYALLAIITVSIILTAFAFSLHPSYSIYYSPLNSVLALRDMENFYSEGMSNVLSYIKDNCTNVYTDGFHQFMLLPYYENSTKYAAEAHPPLCVVTGYANARDVEAFIKTNNCTLKKRITKTNIELHRIYYCE